MREGDTEAVQFQSGVLVRSGSASDLPIPWTHDPRLGAWIAAAHHNWHLADPLSDDRARWEPLVFPQCNLKTLRPDQEEAKAAWWQTKRGVVIMATGTGKTEVALHIIRDVASHTLLVAPTRALAYQLADRLEAAFGMRIGFIGDHTFRVEPISVATYQSAGIKMEFLGDYFKLLIFDECHHLLGDLHADGARMSAAPFRLGLTATHRHSDGRRIDHEELIGPVCYERSIADVRGTILAGYKIVRIPVYLTDEEQRHYDALGQIVRTHLRTRRKQDPRYDWEAVCRTASFDPEARHAFRARLKQRSIEENAAAKLDVLEDLFRKHMQQVVVFAGSNSMVRTAAARFLIPCLLSNTGRKEREVILRGYERGEYRAILANRVLNEGIDVPAAKVGISIGGTGSTREAVQRLGRILRKLRLETAIWYEVTCRETKEEERSNRRRRDDAYQTRGSL